ncbi:ornithine cyclodeaminase family protein [Candidatus Nephthysia bennettiae]|uniref:Ornithine cyclodeaminase family protein n=1 Tax=Candidatus Nephthysia bennettiae TaxID=3127016 RepID=A0A934NB84_9BACT|nr:ornithine cyclodeaminase family protein [Candidatus Dormibacteraeota bacterium]MBJ7614164.1 ornithine cyclodeaminase family protein [Candidatus Dormibacteraeota bacterium]
MALLLRESDIERIADMRPIMDAVEAAMTDLGAGSAQNQPRRRVFPPGGVLNMMSASWPAGGLSGFKAYTVAAGRARFLVTLFDLEGAPVALIEADRLGTLRTGAATGVAARRLTPPGPKTVAVIGTGWQARTQVWALREALEIRELRVFGRDPERRRRFAAQVGAEAAPSAEAAVRGADVVVTMTTSADPVLEASWVAPGALVVGAGSNYPSRAELPPELIHSARAVVVDQLETARLESGDLLRAGYDLDQALELGAVLAGNATLPPGDAAVVFESHGLALWDVAAGHTVLEPARAQSLGEEIRLF